jgi:hypothetical protein
MNTLILSNGITNWDKQITPTVKMNGIMTLGVKSGINFSLKEKLFN